jgi:hypothetical protein
MGKLKILATGKSQQAQAQARGKLFQDLMAEVLRHHGYSIDRIANVNYAGMEIDIEGRAIATGIPLYAECKCYDTEVDSPKLQAFCGKYIALWLRDKRSQGLFIAIPGINSHAKGFYRDNFESRSEITVRLLEEDSVLQFIFASQRVTQPEQIAQQIAPADYGSPGDWLLLYTDHGLFWAFYVILPGSGIPRAIAIFDALGIPISDKTTSDYLLQLLPELGDFSLLSLKSKPQPHQTSPTEDPEEIVEVRGGSACFEYQFPSSPEHFVGRIPVLAEIDSFVSLVSNKQTSSRGILFEANSGWGKSSVVLATVDRLTQKGHLAVSIDCRSASSSQFILRVVNYAITRFSERAQISLPSSMNGGITGFEGVVNTILSFGRLLIPENKLIFIFLDQFENLFFLTEAVKRIRDLFLKICDAQANVILGFSWKTDLVGMTSEFPYEIRDTIAGASKRIILSTFSDVETTALLDKLRAELRAPLRKDLQFLLSEFSQGYPWLLKKLCAHVKSQRADGVKQSDIANSLLNVEELFQEDIRGLTAEEDDALKRIAKNAPIGVSELGDEYRPEVVQSLIHRRLVVRIGNKYDVYWDIFRDYINSGRVPVQENYILRTQKGSVLNAARLLSIAEGALTTAEMRKRAGMSEKSFYNIARDLRLLGLAEVEAGQVRALIKMPQEEKEFAESLKPHLRERLRRNRIVWQVLDKLEAIDNLSIKDISLLLNKSCPYVSATSKTWLTYGRVLADWIDFADLAILDPSNGVMLPYRAGSLVRKRSLVLGKRVNRELEIPIIQYRPIERMAVAIVHAALESKQLDFEGFAESTGKKCLAALEDLGFIKRMSHSIQLTNELFQFVSEPQKRPEIFATGAVKLRSFAKFVEILIAHQNEGLSHKELGVALRDQLGMRWKTSTAETNAKIMLDWARYAGLAPGNFAKSRKGPKRHVAQHERLPFGEM